MANIKQLDNCGVGRIYKGIEKSKQFLYPDLFNEPAKRKNAPMIRTGCFLRQKHATVHIMAHYAYLKNV